MKYDSIILGSSPNALVVAAQLARAGKKVLVLEPTAHVGGHTATTEFAPGFRGDVSFISGRLDEEIVNDLKLTQHGLEVIERDTLTALLPDGKSFTLPRDRRAAAKVIAKFSEKDAVQYPKFMTLVDLATDFLRNTYKVAPPQEHPPTASEAEVLSSFVAKLRGYGRREMTEVIRLLVMPARDFLDEWFETPALKGLLAATAVRGLTQGPFASGTTFNLLHHLATGDGFFRASAKGGVGAIATSLSAAAQAAGAKVRTSSGKVEVIVADGKVTGVQVDGSETIEADQVVSDFDARFTFHHLVAPFELEPEFNRAVQRVRFSGSVARINVALTELPKFTGLSDEALKGTVAVAETVANLERAYDDGKNGRPSAKPFVEFTIPTLTDPSLAPAGKHVMSIWVQYMPYKGKVDAEKVFELAMNRLEEFAPGLRSLVSHKQISTPQTFEKDFNLTEGQLYGGEMTLTQAFYLRPVPGFAQYRTPLEGLFLCGGTTHPGGGLHGLAGQNATKQLTTKELSLASK